MRKYIFDRVVQAAVTILLILVAVFLMARLSGDPVSLMLPPEATKEDHVRMRTQLGLDRPLYEQFGSFVWNAARADFGNSLRWRRPALELVQSRWPITAELAMWSVLLSVATAIPLGVISATRPHSLIDRLGSLIALLGQSLPTFWVGIMLILIFVANLRLLPVSGGIGPQRMILPTITLSLFFIASIMRLTRSSMLNVLDTEYIKLARLKGLPERIVIYKHALKNASIPIVTLIALQLATLINGAVITEIIFALPGIGGLAVDAIYARDYPVVQTVVLVTSVVFTGINLLVDILYGYLDPRIRYR